jgi:hypothetical protein
MSAKRQATIRRPGGASSRRHSGASSEHRSQQGVPSALDRVRQKARTDKKGRFTALLHHVDVDRLRETYRAINPKAATGVDGVTEAKVVQAQLREVAETHDLLHESKAARQLAEERLAAQQRRRDAQTRGTDRAQSAARAVAALAQKADRALQSTRGLFLSMAGFREEVVSELAPTP